MIEFEISAGLGVLRLNSPPVNAISLALLAKLQNAVRRANQEPEVRAIVITGSAGHFSAGADLADFQAIRTGDDAVRMSRTFQEAFQEIEDSEKVIIAAVAGHVLGGALELALSCHYRIAAEGSRFSMPEIRLGINPGAGGTQRLPRLVGLPTALKMLLTGESIDAQRAQAEGLVDAVCPGEALLECAGKLLTLAAPRKTSQWMEKIQNIHARTTALAQAEETVGARARKLLPHEPFSKPSGPA